MLHITSQYKTPFTKKNLYFLYCSVFTLIKHDFVVIYRSDKI